ncbi:MAG: Crp/Fnr family transcriptional regulator [Anaerolineae bacterium]|nr:Crp/Fnr family transcriptional regulator [Anaerolineae bacterium]
MVDIPSLVKRMSRLRYFKGMSITDIKTIISAGHIKKVHASAVIIMEEAPCSGLFVLLSGQVHLYRLGPDGQEVLVDILTPITIFNELAILDGGPNAFTVTAAQNCLIWNADNDVLVSLSERYPQVALGFLPILAARTRVLISMVTDICFLTVRARIAKLILDLSNYGRQSISRQDHTIYKMATQTSTVPEAVSRSLSSFRDAGYIMTSRSTIVVCKPDKLAQIAQVEIEPAN